MGQVRRQRAIRLSCTARLAERRSAEPFGSFSGRWRFSPKALTGSVPVSWSVARDPKLTQIVGRGQTETGASRDFTVKIDAPGLEPGATYYYRFEALGSQLPDRQRTRALPATSIDRVRLGVASCANLPFGYFNAYASLARRNDLDAVLHLGDYFYEDQKTGSMATAPS